MREPLDREWRCQCSRLIRADQRRRAKDKLDAMLVEGLRSGDSISVDAKFWNELKKEAMTKLAARKKSSKK